MSTVLQELKYAALQSGLSMKALSLRSGVYYATIHGFMTGGTQITFKSAERLADVLGLELRLVRKRKPKGG